MEKKEILIALGEQYGLKTDPERSERMAQNGGPLDTVRFIRMMLFGIDVSGYRPLDEPDFDLEAVKK